MEPKSCLKLENLTHIRAFVIVRTGERMDLKLPEYRNALTTVA
jgi:hypothetical protein